MLINWKRLGSAENPRYAAAYLIDGKIRQAGSEKLKQLIVEALACFVEHIAPLNKENQWSTVNCLFNFSAGALWVTPRSELASSTKLLGSVYLVVGDYLDVWQSALPLATAGRGAEFSVRLEQDLREHAQILLEAISDSTEQRLKLLRNKKIRFSGNGTKTIFHSEACSQILAIEGKPPVSSPRKRSAKLVRPEDWSLVSDLVGSIYYSWETPDVLRDDALQEAFSSLVEIFVEKVVPLNEQGTWDCVKGFFSLETSNFSLMPGILNNINRIDRGSCGLATGNFINAIGEYERTGKRDALIKHELKWTEMLLNALNAYKAKARSPILERICIEIWDDDDSVIFSERK